MNQTPTRGPACETALRFLDTYVAAAPSSGSDQAILRHFDECPDCAREFAARARLTARLKQAVEREAGESPYLAAKIRRNLEEYEARSRSPWSLGRNLMLAAAALAVFFAGGIAYQLGHLRLTTASQEAYIGSISRKIAGILRVGLGDHVHCTVFRKLPRKAPSAEQMIADLGPEYSGLLSLVRSHVPERYTIVMAHRCSYHGRKFVHLAMTGDSGLVSLILTRKNEGESFGRDNLLPVLSESGISMYQGGVQRFSIAGFESHDHLVYLVSDLGEKQNVTMLASLAVPVRSFLGKIGS